MLWIFSLAITPWSALHHHPEHTKTAAEKHCTHKVHLKTQKDTCLVCSAHFEKNYTLTKSTFVTYLGSTLLTRNNISISSAYTKLIQASLRGPPSSFSSVI